MPNMSYCRFENTVRDVSDCLDAMRDMEKRESDGMWYENTEDGMEKLNEYEQPNVNELAELCEAFLDEYKNNS